MGGARQIVGQIVLLADVVKVSVAIGAEATRVFIKQTHQIIRAVADGAEAVDEFLVAVAQERAHVREAMLQMKEHRAAAKERLKVAVNLVREEFLKLAEQTRLATHPFQKRLGLNALRHHKRHGELFIVEGVGRAGSPLPAGRSSTSHGAHGVTRPTLRRRFERVGKLPADFVGNLFWIGSLIRPLPCCGLW